jgi:exodeoxyribonuclease-3
VVYTCGIEEYDREGRVLRTDFGDWTLLNCYFPSGTTGEERQAFKMVFLDKFYEYALQLKQERPNLIIVGDYNIAHQEIDIHDPKGDKKSSGFLPEERAWMSKWLESGFTDAFRHINPELTEYDWLDFPCGCARKKQRLANRLPVGKRFAQRQDNIRQSTHLRHTLRSLSGENGD